MRAPSLASLETRLRRANIELIDARSIIANAANKDEQASLAQINRFLRARGNTRSIRSQIRNITGETNICVLCNEPIEPANYSRLADVGSGYQHRHACTTAPIPISLTRIGGAK